MSDTTSATYLKDRVRSRTRTILVAGALILLWVNVGAPFDLESLRGIRESILWSVVPSLVVLVVMVLDSLPGERVKAALVFWRFRHPLPGCRAFESAQLDRDTRADKRRLRELAGGAFPRSPSEQNRLWYRLYRSVEADPRVIGVHTDYLLLRDATWFLVLLLVAACGSFAYFQTRPNAGLALAFLGCYVLTRYAATERGNRFVSTVLAVASSERQSEHAKQP